MRTPSGTARPNVVLLELDACRADKLEIYGFERETSPTIRAFARHPRSRVFNRHYVQGTWTKPSTASLFAGLYPFQHGTAKGFGRTADEPEGEASEFITQALPDEIHTMAERFREAGYHTLAVIKGSVLRPEDGFGQGFAEWHRTRDLGPGNERIARILDILEGSEEPLFAYIHLHACHLPFPPRRRDEAYMEKYGFEYDELARIEAGVDFTQDGMKTKIRGGEIQLTPEDARFLHLIYEAQMKWVDQRVFGPMIAGLADIGLLDESLIIVTADHGEELYDHGGYGHGPVLWEEIIHVPLIVRFPPGSEAYGGEVDEITQAVDLLPSILGFTGIPVEDRLPGRDILSGSGAGFAVAQRSSGTDKEWAMLRGYEKLICPEEGELLLFDLKSDPRETNDLSNERPDRARHLEEMFRRVEASLDLRFTSPDVRRELSAETIEELRSLGYLD